MLNVRRSQNGKGKPVVYRVGQAMLWKYFNLVFLMLTKCKIAKLSKIVDKATIFDNLVLKCDKIRQKPCSKIEKCKYFL